MTATLEITTKANTLYWGWLDLDPKKPLVKKLQEGVERYKQKFGTSPRLCLINDVLWQNEVNHNEAYGLDLLGAHFVGRGMFLFNYPDSKQESN